MNTISNNNDGEDLIGLRFKPDKERGRDACHFRLVSVYGNDTIITIKRVEKCENCCKDCKERYNVFYTYDDLPFNELFSWCIGMVRKNAHQI